MSKGTVHATIQCATFVKSPYHQVLLRIVVNYTFKTERLHHGIRQTLWNLDNPRRSCQVNLQGISVMTHEGWQEARVAAAPKIRKGVTASVLLTCQCLYQTCRHAQMVGTIIVLTHQRQQQCAVRNRTSKACAIVWQRFRHVSRSGSHLMQRYVIYFSLPIAPSGIKSQKAELAVKRGTNVQSWGEISHLSPMFCHKKTKIGLSF